MLEPGHVLKQRYQLQRQLSRNPVRQTWLATDLNGQTAEDSRVTIKILTFGGHIQWDDVKLFEREAQVLQQLDHPQIPNYRDHFHVEDKTTWFGLVEEYIPGETLADMLKRKHPFSEAEARTIALELLQILTYLHRLSPPVLHRDIKPSNVVRGEDGRIYLIDFGAVQDRAAAEGMTYTVVGTYGYTPPEQFGGRAVPASDLYAVGATLVHLVTGVPPADLPQINMQLQFGDLVDASSHFIHWLQALVNPAVERRFSSSTLASDALNNKNRLGIFSSMAIEKPSWTKIKIEEILGSLTLTIPEELNYEVFYNPLIVGVPLLLLCMLEEFSQSVLFCAIIVESVVLILCIPLFIRSCSCSRIEIGENETIFENSLFGFTYRKVKVSTSKILYISPGYSGGEIKSKGDAIEIYFRTSKRNYRNDRAISMQECDWLIPLMQDWLRRHGFNNA